MSTLLGIRYVIQAFFPRSFALSPASGTELAQGEQACFTVPAGFARCLLSISRHRRPLPPDLLTTLSTPSHVPTSKIPVAYVMSHGPPVSALWQDALKE